MQADFPLLRENDIAYLDNAATTQKPRRVIDAVTTFYEESNANPHRSMYALANQATTAVEETREAYADALNTASDTIIFTKNATESINHIALGLQDHIGEDDEILVTELEHHSNYLPWKHLADQTGATLTIFPYDKAQDTASHISEDTSVVAATHMSNVTGEILPVKEIAAAAERHDSMSIIDGCQAFPHMPVDVDEIGCDAYMFSAHKHYGPTGVGITYISTTLQDTLTDEILGGGMVDAVSKDSYTPSSPPHRREAGTINAAGLTGSHEALRFLESNRDDIEQHEAELQAYTLERLDDAGITYYGHDNDSYGPVISLDIDEDAYDIAHILDQHDVCIRSGNHCADPLMSALNTPGTPRISIGAYNDKDDIDTLLHALQDATSLLGGRT